MKHAPQHLWAGEADRARNTVQGAGAVLEEHPGVLDPQAFDIGGRGLTDLTQERSGEGAGAHRRALRERRDAEVRIEVAADPLLQVPQLRADSHLC